ncbi:PAS domain-containing protein [candidate division WOR-3 bacterium]|nr:PAS domain-containing protein [candidate division WOR-3 bacterium]
MVQRVTRQTRLRIGIQDRIIIWLLVLGILPVLAMALLGHLVMSRSAISAAGVRLQAVAERLAQGIDLGLRDVMSATNDLGLRDTELRRLVAAAPDRGPLREWIPDSAAAARRLQDSPFAARLERALANHPQLGEDLLVTDGHGNVLGSTRPVSRPCCADETWWRQAWNEGRGSTHVGKLQYSGGSHQIIVAVPVLDSTRTRALGVVRVRADVSELVAQVEDIEVGATGFATLLSAFGDVLVSPLPRVELSGVLTSERRQRLGTGYPGWFEDRGLLPRSTVVAALAPVPATHGRSRANPGSPGWTVSVEQDRAEILASTHRFGRTAVYVLLFTAAMVMITGLLLSDRILRPLRELRDGARDLGSGRLDRRIEARTGDEIAELAAEFNAMAARLKRSHEDLEERVRSATAELAREKNSLEAILAALGEGLMVLDRDHRIVLWNRAAERMTGLAAEQVIGRSCRSVIDIRSERHPDLCTVICPARIGMAERRTTSHNDMATRITTRDGRLVWVALTASPLLEDSGEPTGCVVVLMDVTREREIDRLKSTVISTVSHELRGPLTPLIGFAELLAEEELPDAKRRQYARLIAVEGRRLERMVNDFLTLSRIEAGRFELRLGKVDVRRLVDEIIAVEQGQHPDHRLENLLPADFPAVTADPDQLKRALYNLVSNAIKYSPAGGPVRVSGRVADGRAAISVTDEGTGIRPEDLDRLFHRFGRLDEHRGISGTGLGLSITAAIVREHGGEVTVQSEHGRGSTFTISIPVAGPAPKPTAA